MNTNEQATRDSNKEQQLCAVVCEVIEQGTPIIFNKGLQQFIVSMPVNVVGANNQVQPLYDNTGEIQKTQVIFSAHEISNLVVHAKQQLIQALKQMEFINRVVKNGTAVSMICQQELLKEMPQLADVVVEAEILSGVKVDII